MKNKLAAVTALLLLSSLAAGCSAPAEQIVYCPVEPTEETVHLPDESGILPAANTEGTASEESTIVPVQSEETANGFAYRLYDELYTGENIFFSPYSVSTALSMLDNGAQNNTKSEIEALLGISDISVRNAQIGSMTSYNDEKIKFLPANSVWINEERNSFSKRMNGEFIAPITEYYGAEVFSANFSDDGITSQVNKWISGKTNKMIDNMLDKVDKDTAMLIINAVYFEGEWSVPFEADGTQSKLFHGANGNSNVEMMSMSGANMKYAETGELKCVRLPYGNGGVAMDIIIANDTSDKTAPEIFFAMTQSERQQAFDALSLADEVNISTLSIPKFKFDSGNIELAVPLANLGMKEAFDENAADFDIIGDDIYVSKVTHKAVIEVDEMGSKAAAATVIQMKDNCMPIIEEDAVTFVADKPFVFTITDTETGTILFMGTINDL